MENASMKPQSTIHAQTTDNDEWYEAGAGNHQALIISQKTGKSIAVAYDKKDAPLIASAPTLLAERDRLKSTLEAIAREIGAYPDSPRPYSAYSYLPARLVSQLISALAL